MRTAISAIEERLELPSARGLAQAVSRAVRDGALAPGAKLPPIRAVATQLGLSPTTVSAGWALLARSGAIRTDGRRGTTIAGLQDLTPGRYLGPSNDSSTSPLTCRQVLPTQPCCPTSDRR